MTNAPSNCAGSGRRGSRSDIRGSKSSTSTSVCSRPRSTGSARGLLRVGFDRMMPAQGGVPRAAEHGAQRSRIAVTNRDGTEPSDDVYGERGRECDPLIPARVAAHHAQQVSRIEIEAKGLPARLTMAGALEVADHGVRREPDAPTGRAQAKGQVEIFGIREE